MRDKYEQPIDQAEQADRIARDEQHSRIDAWAALIGDGPELL